MVNIVMCIGKLSHREIKHFLVNGDKTPQCGVGERKHRNHASWYRAVTATQTDCVAQGIK